MKRELLADPTLWVDRCGALFFVDSAPERVAVPASGEVADNAPAAIEPADAFTLHSRPGSNRTIFLDFDGQTITGTAWNSEYLGTTPWTAPAWDLDGNTASFSETERQSVIQVWQRVADDYAPFDVDVTTADPGAAALERSSDADQSFGTRALITADSAAASVLCGNSCGGVAYLDVFDEVGSSAYQPAWVFTHKLANVAKYIADSVAHEVGHNLSLEHDGLSAASPSGPTGYYRGSGGWGPIMGAPYARQVTQWSRGEYPFASNTEDDVALISSAGAPLLPDDAGETAATATPITPGTPRSGMITSAADVDWYSMAASGRVSATVTPLAQWPNLDTRLVLTSSDGAELATSETPFSTSTWPANAAASVMDFQLPAAGSYRLRVEGVGNGVANTDGSTDYGSLGTYVLAVDTGLTVTGPPATLDLIVGAPASLQLEAALGVPPYIWSVTTGSLPPGLASSGSTITGTPTTAGVWLVPVSVTDAAASTASRDLALTVLPALAVASPPGAVGLTVGVSATLGLTASGGRAPYTWSLASGSLPPGLAINGTSVSGVPSAAGSWSATFRATDASAHAVTRSVAFTVADRVAITSPVSTVRLIVGATATVNLTSSGGTAPLTWSMSREALPTGMALSGSVISGTPTEPGTWTSLLGVTDALGATANQYVTFEVVPALAVVDLGTDVWMIAGRSTTVNLSAVGGFGAREWSLASGSLPPGMSLSGASVTGTPTEAGTWTATVQVRDETSTVAQRSLNFQVAEGGMIPDPAASATADPAAPAPQSAPQTQPVPQALSRPLSLPVRTALPSAGKKRSYLQRLTATGGSGQLIWRRASGKLPKGIKLQRAGVLAGKPTKKGKYKFTLKVTDAAGKSATGRYTLRVK